MMYTKEHLEVLVRYFHPERKYPFLRGAFNHAAHASLFGIREQLYVKLRESLTLKMQEEVDKKLRETDLASKIKQLSFAKGSKIVALGDSLTDDLLSWFEMLRYACAEVRPEDDLQFVNFATTGDNSSQVLQSVVEAHQLQDVAHIFCLIGTNDSRCFGHGIDKANISFSEFQANISSIMQFHQQQPSVKWTWLLPVEVDLERINADPFLQNLQLSWKNSQIREIQKYLAERSEPSIEIESLVTSKSFHERDGLHWTLQAHSCVFDKVLNELLETSQ